MGAWRKASLHKQFTWIRVVGQFHARAALLLQTIYCTSGWVSPTGSLYVVAKRNILSLWGIKHQSSSAYPVTLLTAQTRFTLVNKRSWRKYMISRNDKWSFQTLQNGCIFWIRIYSLWSKKVWLHLHATSYRNSQLQKLIIHRMWHFQQKKKLPRKEVYMEIDTMHSPSSSTHFMVKTWSWGKRQISLISWHNCSTVICGSMYVIITSLGKKEKNSINISMSPELSAQKMLPITRYKNIIYSQLARQM
jgi:hypothetical protein